MSNATQKKNFHPSIHHVSIGTVFSSKQKALFQFLLSFLPISVMELFYGKFLKQLTSIINKTVKDKESVYFFEYLDNSIGYVLKKSGIISSYINDVHGVAPIEFEMQVELSKNIKYKLLNRIKYLSAKLLDKKVFNHGDGFIYPSNKVKEYYETTTLRTQKESYIIPNLIGHIATKKIDNELRSELIKTFNITEDSFTFLFAGIYKPTSGVDDLINAFKKLYFEYPHVKLILIGKGKIRDKCEKLAESVKDSILFVDSCLYEKLLTYQSIANVIVCPDKMNLYSNMIVHLKYLDALISGKLVINGDFGSVKEINKDDFLSLTFEPSNVDSLYKTMKNSLENYDHLVVKYKDVDRYTVKHLSYRVYINTLML